MHLVIAITPNSALGKEPSINLDMPWRSDEVLDACELDHGPSNASISPAIDKPRNDYVFDAIEWDPGPQSACRLEVATSKRRSDYDLKQSLEPTSLVSAIPNELQTIQVFRVNECFTSGSKNIAAQLASTKHVNNTLDHDCLAFDAQLKGIGNLNSSFALHDTINERASLPQSLADDTNKVTSQQLYPKTNLDAIELDPGPSLCSSTHQSSLLKSISSSTIVDTAIFQAQIVFDQLFCRTKIMPIMREVR
jgi:hypothetical protein